MMNEQLLVHNFISPNAHIGSDVTIGPYTYIDEDVTIGDGCHIYPNVTILKGTRLGNHCTVFPGAVLGAIPQDLKFKGEESILEIGDHTTIRECCTLNRGTSYSGTTKVGSHCLLMAYVHVAHDCIVGDHVVIANSVNLAGHVEISDHVILGGLVAVHQFSKIGAYSMVGGTGKVRKDIPPYIKVDREPLQFMGVNTIGLQRNGFDPGRIESIKQIYHHLFVKNDNLQKALQTVADTCTDDQQDLQSILQFIENSERGIVRGYNQ